MTTSSDKLINDFYKGQARRMERLVQFMLAVFVLTLGFLIWVKVDTNHLINSLKEQNAASATRSATRDAQLKDIADGISNLGKSNNDLLLCLLSLHDPDHFGSLTANVDCQATVDSVSKTQQAAQATSDGEPLPGTPSNPTPPQTAPEQPTQPDNDGVMLPSVGIGPIHIPSIHIPSPL